MNYIKEYKRSLSLEGYESGREFLRDMQKILAIPQVSEMVKYRHHLRVNRYQHLLSVSYMSYIQAKRRGLRYKEMAQAAMLHDLFYYDYKDRENYPKKHNRRHAETALENAQRLLSLSELQREIILTHMWPITASRPVSAEARIVCKTDKICSVFECIYSVFSGKKRIID